MVIHQLLQIFQSLLISSVYAQGSSLPPPAVPYTAKQANTIDISSQIGTDFFKFDSVGQLISTGITVVIAIGTIIFFVFLVAGGIQWLTSGGDKAKVQQARDHITNALIGLVILALSWAIWIFILNLFGVEGLIAKTSLTTPLYYQTLYPD